MGALIPLILPLVPQLAKWLAGPLAGETATTVENVITSIVGSARPEDLQAALKDPEKLAALQVQIAQIAADREKAERQADLDELRTHVEDTVNSRSTMTQLVQAGSRLGAFPAAMSVVVLSIFLVVLVLLLTGVAKVGQDSGLQQLSYVLLGTLAAMVTQVGNFWLGSSKGSVDKQADLTNAMHQLTNSVPINTLPQITGGSGVAGPFADPGSAGLTQRSPVATPTAGPAAGQPSAAPAPARVQNPMQAPAQPRMPAPMQPRVQPVVTPVVPAATLDVLARTVWGEARGEGQAGMEAVACVIRNRALNRRWWGNDIPSVCKHPFQFSCWNANDPNLPKLQSVGPSDPAFATALSVARTAATGQLPDPTAGADSYFADSIPAPSWASRAKFTRQIGHHRFYRVELPDPQGQPSAPNIAAPQRELTADELNARQLQAG